MNSSELFQIGTQRPKTGLKRLFHRYTLSFIAVIILTLAMTSVASADSQTVKFSAEADVIGLVPGGIVVSTFFTKKNGDIKKVEIETFGETIVGGDLDPKCKGGNLADDFCSAIDGSAVLSIHTSLVKLDKITEIDVGSGISVLEGKIKGHLNSDFSISVDNGSLSGTARLKIRGTATYGCFTFRPLVPGGLFPETLGVCQGNDPAPGPPILLDSGPVMLPFILDVKDSGEFDILGPTLDGLGDISSVRGKVKVTLLFDGVTASGTIEIKNAKVEFDD